MTAFFERSFAERLCEESSLEARVKVIETLFLKSLCKLDAPTDPQVTYAVEQINRHQGRLPVQSLMSDICLCQRQCRIL